MKLIVRDGRDAGQLPIHLRRIQAHHAYPAGSGGLNHDLCSPLRSQEYVMSNDHFPSPPPSEPERETLDLPDLAERLGVSRSSIYRWANDGRLPTIRLGRRLLVPRAVVEELLAPHRDAQMTEAPDPRSAEG